MKKLKSILLNLILLTTLTIAQSIQQFADIGDLKLTNGDTLLNCKIGYRTSGELNSDSSNIVIYPTWFAGTSTQIGGLIEKRNFIDASKFFVIAIDAIANGVSTSPSNSELQNNKNFPKVTIEDMVNSQHKMLTENLGFKHIHAIVGGSMGSMQALQWIVSYPDFIEKAVPYVATPRRSTYDDLILKFRKRMIELYQELGADDKLINIMISYTTQLFARSPEYIVENISHDDFEKFIDEKIENREPSKTFTIENHLAQLKAMASYNIYKNFNNSVSETAKHIKTEVFFILNKTDHLVNPTPALELADELNCKVLLLDNNCGHLGIGCELEKCGIAINQFLSSTKE
jgi:homoserine acetyltransferase